MKKFSEMIREYKKNPSEKLKNTIIHYLVNMDTPEDLDTVCPVLETDWAEFDNIRVKRISDSVFAVTEIFGVGSSFMCYAYKIDLTEYADEQLSAYESYCERYSETAPDRDYFAAVSVASAYNVDDAETSQLVLNETEKQKWLAQVDREVC